MTYIPTSFPVAQNAESRSKQENPLAGSSPFDAVFTKVHSLANLRDLASTFIENIIRSLDSTLTNPGTSTPPAFPFSEEFEATFGTSGPLLDFINITTSKLNLSADQNRALQMIAIHNKDTKATPEDIQKIAGELKQAGIG